MLKLVTVLEAVPEKDELHGIAQNWPGRSDHSERMEWPAY